MKIDIFNAEEKYDILYTDPLWQQGRGGKNSSANTGSAKRNAPAKDNDGWMDIPDDVGDEGLPFN